MATKSNATMPRSTDAAQAGRTATAAIVRSNPNVDLSLLAGALPGVSDEAVKTIAAIAIASGVEEAALLIPQNRAPLRMMYDFIVNYAMVPGRDFYPVVYPTTVKEDGKERTVNQISVQRSHASYQVCAQEYAKQFGLLLMINSEVLIGAQAIEAALTYGHSSDFVREGESTGRLHPSVSVARARTVLIGKGMPPVNGDWHYYVMPSEQGPRASDRPKKIVKGTTVVNFTRKRAEAMAYRALTRQLHVMDPRANAESHRLLVAAQAALAMADDAANAQSESFIDVTADEVGASTAPYSAEVVNDGGSDELFVESVSVAELAAELWSEQPIARLAFEARKAGEGKQDGKDFGKSLEAVKAGIASNLGLETGNDLVETLIEYVGIDSLATLKAFALSIFERSQNGGINPKSPTEGFGAVKTAIQTLGDRLNA